MSHYTGIDIVEISRIDSAVGRWGDRFLRRVFTEKEIDAYRDRVPSLAARFAGKEAVMKLLGKGWDRVRWTDIEILGEAESRPSLTLLGQARHEAEKMRLKDVSVSLSHSREYAVACALGSD